MPTDTNTGQSIYAGSPRSGLRNVGSYQVSGHPFISGSDNLDNNKVHMVQFPYVTKSVTVINTSATRPIRVHLQSGSATAVTVPGDTGAQTIADTGDVIANFNYITVQAGYSALTLDVKCKEVFISNGSGASNLSYQVFAELTYIPTSSMPHLTGSGITE